MRSAPSVPRIVLMKNPWNPLVVAWVMTNMPTPSTMQSRLISMERFFAVRNRSAMRKLGDMNGSGQSGRRGRYLLHGIRGDLPRPHPLAGMKFLQAVDDDLLARLQALGDFGAGGPFEALFHLPLLDHPVPDDIDAVTHVRKNRPARHDGLGGVPVHDDDNFSIDPRRNRMTRVHFDVEIDHVALGFRIGGRQNLGHLALEEPGTVGDEGDLRLLPLPDLREILLADFALHQLVGRDQGRQRGARDDQVAGVGVDDRNGPVEGRGDRHLV